MESRRYADPPSTRRPRQGHRRANAGHAPLCDLSDSNRVRLGLDSPAGGPSRTEVPSDGHAAFGLRRRCPVAFPVTADDARVAMPGTPAGIATQSSPGHEGRCVRSGLEESTPSLSTAAAARRCSRSAAPTAAGRGHDGERSPSFRAVSVDFDGTLADGLVALYMLAALGKGSARGIRVILVCGRTMSELRAVSRMSTTTSAWSLQRAAPCWPPPSPGRERGADRPWCRPP